MSSKLIIEKYLDYILSIVVCFCCFQFFQKNYFYAVTHDINGGEDNMYTADNICRMIEFLIDNILCSLEGVFSVR